MNPDTIEVKIWWYEKAGAWIAANTRGFATFVKALMQPTNIKVETNPNVEWGHWFGQGRLDDTGVLGDELPSTRIAVTKSMNDPTQVDTPIEIPEAPIGAVSPSPVGISDGAVLDPLIDPEMPIQFDFFDILIP